MSDLEVSYGSHLALAGVSLEAAAGEVTALVGANGAGKTTLLNAISGLRRPSRGAIEWAGARLDGLRPDEIGRRGVIQVPEGRKLFPRMTVKENLEIGAYAPESRRRRAEGMDKVFSLFPRLKDRRSQAAGTLSGGEQQMLALGRAIMAWPSFLLMDEPTEGLAPRLAVDIFRVIRSLNEDGLGILLVSQEVRQTLALARRAYCLENGRIVLSGPGRELLADPGVRQAYLGL
ncbi:MAG: ABC transporter ATP-binding protein [Thermodesulfobacteriota bacterium]